MHRPMRTMTWTTMILTAVLIQQSSGFAAEEFPLGPDSKLQPGVPRGAVKGPFEWKSEIFPGTVRSYWLYVPAQYDAAKKTCVLVVQDGVRRAEGWHLTPALDNLIHRGEVPPMIGVFVNPGVVPAPHENAQPRFNRSFEYDGLGDRYARFLLDEILPEVKKSYNLSDDPNDRAIAGASSGAICAFTAAWERPDAFRRVLSTIGTYVSLRGGNEYSALIRKVEPKPIRVFLQDGSADLNLYGGDWWMANQSMLSSLQFAGYDVKNAWSDGGHDSKHSAAIMPEALRWLWRDYPRPITAGRAAKRLTDILISGEDWELVSDGHGFTEGPAANAAGEVFFSDGRAGRIHRVGLDGIVTVFAEGYQGVGGLMFSASGDLWACQGRAKKVLRFDASGDATTVFEGAPSNDLVKLPGGLYYTDPRNKKVWYATDGGERRVVDEGIEFTNGVIASADQTLLFVADTRGRFIYSFQIQSDGSLAHRQKYGHVHVPDDSRDSGADGMTVDTHGRLYVATRMGVQVFDQLGRCHLILSKPQTGWLSNVVFGGRDLNYIYVTCTDKVFRRRLNATGVVPWRDPVKPPRPRL